jgi:hypothetical protein
LVTMAHAPAPGTDEDAPRVVLAFPAKPEYVGLARLALAGLGAWGGLEPEVVADLKVAVSESCALLLRGVAPSTGFASTAADASAAAGALVRSHTDAPAIRIDFILAEDQWALTATAVGEIASAAGGVGEPLPDEGSELGDLGPTIIRALVDEAELGEPGAGVRTVRLIKNIR